MELITPQEARLKFSDGLFVKTMEDVQEAICKAAQNDYTVTLDIPTGIREGKDCVAFCVAQALRHAGFNVTLIHDPENGSSELTISW